MEAEIDGRALCEFEICEGQRVDLLERVIRHEIGHYIASQLFFPAGRIVVCLLDQGGLYDCYVQQSVDRRLVDSASIVSYLEARIVTIFAGAAAESITEGTCKSVGINRVLATEGCGKDKSNIDELIILLRNIRFAESSDDEFNEGTNVLYTELREKARALIDGRSEMVSLLTQSISEHVKLGGWRYTFTPDDIALFLTKG